MTKTQVVFEEGGWIVRRGLRIVSMPLLLLALWSSPPQAIAGECLVYGNKAAQVERGGKAVTLPLALRECEPIKVIKGKVEVFFPNGSGRLKKQAVSRGQTFDPQAARAAGSGALYAFLSAIQDALLGDPQDKGAVSRGEKPPLGSVLPRGLILPPEEDVELRLGVLPVKRIAIQPSSAKPTRPVFAADRPADRVTIPRGALKPEARYDLRVDYGDGESYATAFRVADLRQSAQLANQTRAIHQDRSLSPETRLILLAAHYDEEGYEFERDRMLARLRDHWASGG